MNRTLATFLSALALLATAQGKPKIAERAGVRAVASAEDRSILALGAPFEINGEELGPSEAAAAELPYPKALAGVTVKLTSTSDPAVTVDAYVVSASHVRIVAILPSAAAPGEYRVSSAYNDETSNTATVKVAPRNFGLVTNTGGFAGMIQARRLVQDADPAAVTLADAALPGATLELDAAGLGPIDSADNDLPPEVNLAPDALLLIGDHEVPVTYLGRNPSKPGFDKLIVTLPAENLPASCLALLKVKIGETVSLSASIPLLGPDETSCKHPMGFSPETLASLASGGSIIRGGFYLARLTGLISAAGMTFESKADQFSGGFVRFTAAEIAQMTANSLIAGAYDSNRCVVHDAIEGTAVGAYVDAGDKINLTGPAWNVDIPRAATVATGLNQYNLLLDSKFNGAPLPIQPAPPGLLMQPGNHTLTGPGGTVIGAFTIDLDIPGQFQWTNIDELTEVDSGKDLVFLFSGGGPDDTIAASGLVKGPAPEAPSNTVSRAWVCLAKGSDGRIVVPSSLLQKLPKVSAAEVANPATGRYSSVSLGSYNPTGVGEFRAPVVEGGQTEPIVFLFSYTYSRSPVPIK